MHPGDTHQTTSTQTPSVSQRIRTFAPNHHHHPTNVHSFPPPTNHPTCTLQDTTQRPRNHRVHSISRLLQHPPLHRPYITPSTRTFGSQKASHLIKTLNKTAKQPPTLTRKTHSNAPPPPNQRKSTTSHPDISRTNVVQQKSSQAHKHISSRPKSI